MNIPRFISIQNFHTSIYKTATCENNDLTTFDVDKCIFETHLNNDGSYFINELRTNNSDEKNKEAERELVQVGGVEILADVKRTKWLITPINTDGKILVFTIQRAACRKYLSGNANHLVADFNDKEHLWTLSDQTKSVEASSTAVPTFASNNFMNPNQEQSDVMAQASQSSSALNDYLKSEKKRSEKLSKIIKLSAKFGDEAWGFGHIAKSGMRIAYLTTPGFALQVIEQNQVSNFAKEQLKGRNRNSDTQVLIRYSSWDQSLPVEKRNYDTTFTTMILTPEKALSGENSVECLKNGLLYTFSNAAKQKYENGISIDDGKNIAAQMNDKKYHFVMLPIQASTEDLSEKIYQRGSGIFITAGVLALIVVVLAVVAVIFILYFLISLAFKQQYNTIFISNKTKSDVNVNICYGDNVESQDPGLDEKVALGRATAIGEQVDVAGITTITTVPTISRFVYVLKNDSTFFEGLGSTLEVERTVGDTDVGKWKKFQCVSDIPFGSDNSIWCAFDDERSCSKIFDDNEYEHKVETYDSESADKLFNGTACISALNGGENNTYTTMFTVVDKKLKF